MVTQNLFVCLLHVWKRKKMEFFPPKHFSAQFCGIEKVSDQITPGVHVMNQLPHKLGLQFLLIHRIEWIFEVAQSLYYMKKKILLVHLSIYRSLLPLRPIYEYSVGIVQMNGYEPTQQKKRLKIHTFTIDKRRGKSHPRAHICDN